MVLSLLRCSGPFNRSSLLFLKPAKIWVRSSARPICCRNERRGNYSISTVSVLMRWCRHLALRREGEKTRVQPPDQSLHRWGTPRARHLTHICTGGAELGSIQLVQVCSGAGLERSVAEQEHFIWKCGSNNELVKGKLLFLLQLEFPQSLSCVLGALSMITYPTWPVRVTFSWLDGIILHDFLRKSNICWIPPP